MNGGGEKGIKALYKEISQLVGFEPDYQVIVEWEAVGKIVDAIGGVDFDVPHRHGLPRPGSEPGPSSRRQGLPAPAAATTPCRSLRCRREEPINGQDPYGYNKGGVGDAGPHGDCSRDFLKAVIKQLMQPEKRR